MLARPHNAVVTEWPTSSIWFDEDGILCMITKKGPVQTLEQAKAEHVEFKKLLKGKMVCMLIDVTNASESSRETRDYAARELPNYVKALALLSGSAIGKMLAKLFITIKIQPYPTKVFANEKDAKTWLKNYL